MHYNDAKIFLEDLLLYEYTDSLLVEYKERDSLNNQKITFQKSQLEILTEKNVNFQQMLNNFEELLSNKDKENEILQNIIKEQKKEIRKQKFLKVVGFSAAVVLPILLLLSLS